MKQTVLPFVKDQWFTLVLLFTLLYAIQADDLTFRIYIRTQPAAATTPATQVAENEAASIPAHLPEKEEMGTWQSAFETPSVSLNKESVASFVQRFQGIAQSEERKYGVPGSILLGLAIVHSQAGQAKAAVKGNNYFGLRCTGEWSGQGMMVNGVCHRQYDNAWEGFRDHTLTLVNAVADGNAKKIGPHYRSWIAAMNEKSLPYVDYSGLRLREAIEQYGLESK